MTVISIPSLCHSYSANLHQLRLSISRLLGRHVGTSQDEYGSITEVEK